MTSGSAAHRTGGRASRTTLRHMLAGAAVAMLGVLALSAFRTSAPRPTHGPPPDEVAQALTRTGAGDTPVLRGKVIDVIDGDSVEVQLQSGRIQVRLHAADAPEHDQPGGRDAGRALRKRLPRGSEVGLESVPTGPVRPSRGRDRGGRRQRKCLDGAAGPGMGVSPLHVRRPLLPLGRRGARSAPGAVVEAARRLGCAVGLASPRAGARLPTRGPLTRDARRLPRGAAPAPRSSGRCAHAALRTLAPAYSYREPGACRLSNVPVHC